MMDTMRGTCEIVESAEELNIFSEEDGKYHMMKPRQRCLLEDDINKLFEAIEIRKSIKGFGRKVSKDTSQKNAMKKPMRGGSSRAMGIGISEPVSLKQALRGLCISQASEMAAMKRLSRSVGSPGMSEAGNIKKLYSSVVIDASGSGLSLYEGEKNMVEVSLVPERSVFKISEQNPESQKVPKVEVTNQTSYPWIGCEDSKKESKYKGKFPEVDDVVPVSVEVLPESVGSDKKQKSVLDFASSLSTFKAGNKAVKSPSTKPHLTRPSLKNKNFFKKKVNQSSVTASCSSCHCNGDFGGDLGPGVSNFVCESPKCTVEDLSKQKEKETLAWGSKNVSVEVGSAALDSGHFGPDLSSNCSDRTKTALTNPNKRSFSREKGDFSYSSKSSLGEYSTSTSISDESNQSGSVRSGYRPHMSKDLRWEAIHGIRKQHKTLGLRHFKLLNKLGSGDIGTVYLAELNGTNCLFALKVMDNEFLASRKKMVRAQTEREILQMLDHPFLPTLFAHFTTDKYLCLVMEYCPGGDLHVLRQKQPCKSYSEEAARFYVAEVLLALEYLHMLGVVYRDLKPENVLVREDGHIMLSDFDLSFRCAVNPTVVKWLPPIVEPAKTIPSHCTESNCIEPLCLHPSWQVPCFAPTKPRKLKSDLATQTSPLPQLVAEPTDARSNSFVGTHEYLAPEIIKGEGHGSAVDWWTFGIFIYELLYGKTPFKGPGNEETLANVISLSLRFPETTPVSFHARDLIRGLLRKEPGNRLGSVKGAAEIKQHPFFEGMNWALIRCAIPPELPKIGDSGNGLKSTTGDDLDFEIF